MLKSSNFALQKSVERVFHVHVIILVLLDIVVPPVMVLVLLDMVVVPPRLVVLVHVLHIVVIPSLVVQVPPRT